MYCDVLSLPKQAFRQLADLFLQTKYQHTYPEQGGTNNFSPLKKSYF